METPSPIPVASGQLDLGLSSSMTDAPLCNNSEHGSYDGKLTSSETREEFGKKDEELDDGGNETMKRSATLEGEEADYDEIKKELAAIEELIDEKGELKLLHLR